MKSIIPLFLFLSLLSADSIDELTEALQQAVENQDTDELFGLYYTDGFDQESIDWLKSSASRTLKETETYILSHVSSIDYSNFSPQTDGQKISYYPHKYLSGGIHATYTYKKGTGSGSKLFPLVQVEGEYYLAARKIEKVSNTAEKSNLYRFNISLKDDNYEVVAPLFVTYTIGGITQNVILPARQGSLLFTEIISVSCGPIPNTESATLSISKDGEITEVTFDPRLGLNWKKQK
jgi:hypothetical protein